MWRDGLMYVYPVSTVYVRWLWLAGYSCGRWRVRVLENSMLGLLWSNGQSWSRCGLCIRHPGRRAEAEVGSSWEFLGLSMQRTPKQDNWSWSSWCLVQGVPWCSIWSWGGHEQGSLNKLLDEAAIPKVDLSQEISECSVPGVSWPSQSGASLECSRLLCICITWAKSAHWPRVS